MTVQSELPSQTPPTQPELPKNNTVILLVIVGILAVLGVLAGVIIYKIKRPVTPTAPTSNQTVSSPVTAVLAAAKRLIRPEDISIEEVEVAPKIPPYQLPLNTSSISNFEDFANKISLSQQTEALLEKNGFAVIGSDNLFTAKEDFSDFYSEIQDKDLPVFITTDSLLHYYHVFFDTSLMRMEKDIFFDDIWQMSKGFYDDSLDIYQKTSDPILKEASKRNIAYLSVAIELLKPKPDQIVSNSNVKDLVDCYAYDEYCDKIYADTIQNGTFSNFGQEEAIQYSFNPPDFVKTLAAEELNLINGHNGWDCSPIFLYEEDYSQYVPRGHYTKTERLKNYFKALMWYGRMTNLIKGSPSLPEGKCVKSEVLTKPPEFISEKDAQIQTLQASILARKFALDVDTQKNWGKIYAITSYFVGFSDDLGPVEYSSALKSIFGESVDTNLLTNKVDEIQKTIKQDFPGPKIYSGLGNAKMIVMPQPPLTPEQINELKKQADELLANTTGFRMMGQRYVVDSDLFSKIVSPYSGEYTGPKDKKPFTYVITDMGREVRGFPRGLDIMALFGSQRAAQIIKNSGDADYSDYQEQFDILKKEIDAIPQNDWYKNLYWNWLYVLKSLIAKTEAGYPSFMQTSAWQDKELATALASWSELRHDTILYAKQSYSGAEMGAGGGRVKIVGYVEPVPVFYSRLLNLTKMTKSGLTGLLSQEEWSKIGVGDAMGRFEEILSRLVDISKTELENKELTDEDYLFIKYFGSTLSSVSASLLASEGNVDLDMFKPTLIADVHTDGNTKKVLEEGVGYIKPMVVAYKLPNNYILIGVGPVFSYYEFKQPMDSRLTDEKWRDMLQTNPPLEPEWVGSFSK